MDLYPLHFQNDLKKTLLFLIVLASSCGATTNQIDFGFGRGMPLSSINLDGNSDKEGARGTEWFVEALHKVTSNLYLGVGTSRFSSEDNISYTLIPNDVSRISSKMTATFLLGRLDLIPGSKYVVYGIAGIGFVRNTLAITATPNTAWTDTGTTEPRTFMDDTSNAFGYIGGVGIDLSLTDRIVIGLETRYQGSDERSFSLSPQGEQATGQASISSSVNSWWLGLKAGIKY